MKIENCKLKISKKGFTLVEILVYVAILAIAGGLLTSILLVTTRVGKQESASNEVTSQLNLVTQTFNRLVRESSNIEIEAGISTSTLKLRMKDDTKDPTYISLSDNVIKIKQGSADWFDLTSSAVIVDSLSFKKFSQYPGHDTISVDAQISYNTTNPQGQAQRTLHSAIARV